ncbi:MAG: hypothetical protein KF795_03925 [Labilithrix sp.]|nr:hypothetical protein [Labilithrix sp.]
MRFGLVLTVVLGALTVGAGCATTEPPMAVDPSSDPAWIPPGQGDLDVADSQIEEKPKAKPRARHLQEPNRREMDSRLHAKTGSARQ